MATRHGLGIVYWASHLREKAGAGSAVRLSYPDACLVASALEEAQKRIQELESAINSAEETY